LRSDRSLSSAIALTKPFSASSFAIANVSQDGPQTESLSTQIDSFTKTRRFPIKASTRACIAITKCALVFGANGPAITFTKPPLHRVSRLRFFQNRQPSVFLSNQIEPSHKRRVKT
jgi:hypothetical protein